MLIAHPEENDAGKRVQFRRSNKRLWPDSDRNMSYEIPQSLRLEHTEAPTCFRNAAYAATVVMVRRTLEGVCSENGVTRKPLIKALQQMKGVGLI